MKKYSIKELKEAIVLIGGIEGSEENSVIKDFNSKLEQEYKKRNKPKFVKATDTYLSNLSESDVYRRLLVESDEHYYKGMYGMFERGTDKLLRRHTDTGFLKLPR
jgi:hypothetical protein